LNQQQYLAATNRNKAALTKSLNDIAADIDMGETDMLDFMVVQNLSQHLRRLADEQQQVSEWMEGQVTGNRIARESA
jgi:hypothetical protein